MKFLILAISVSMSSAAAFAQDRILCGDRSKDSFFFDVNDLVRSPGIQKARIDLSFKNFRSFAVKLESMFCVRPVVGALMAEHAPVLHCESARFEIIVEKGTGFPALFVADVYGKQTGLLQQANLPCQVTTVP